MDSLLTQTYPDIEIIVVDDCSTDRSREYLNTYKSHPKVSLFFLESNNGYVHASNYGVSKANGEYIIFAECDDFSEPDQIDSLYQAITTNNNIGVAWSGSHLTDETGNIIGTDFPIRSTAFQNYCRTDVQVPGWMVLKFMMHSNVVPNMSTAMFKKSLFTRIGGLSEKYKLSADLDFWVRMAEVGDFYYLKKPLNNFRTHPDSVRNHLGTSVQLIEMIDIISHLKKKVKRTLKEKIELKMHLGNLWFYYAKNEFHSFYKTFVTVLTNTFRQEPLLLFFMLLSFPVLSVKKIGKLLNP
ncbi:MAG: glycosyltransferase [Bacteroidetes bacterium]|nr:glycosyltransferase [Bacteroidota bacterium]